MRIVLWASLAVVVASCSAVPTVEQRQDEYLRNVKVRVKAKGINPDTAAYSHDEANSAWSSYWSTPGLTMGPEHKRWDDQIHAIWIYRAVPAERGSADVLWVFVDRQTGQVLGDLEAH